MAKKQRGNPPSRKRYETSHPVISLRTDEEIRNGLREAKEKKGMSCVDVLKVGLGLTELTIRAEEEIRQQAYEAGWERGNEVASNLYAVTYPCSKCGKEMTVDTDEEKKAIRKFLTSSGWHHGDCSDPYE